MLLLVLIGIRFASPAVADFPPEPDDFIQIAPVGFGDPVNSAAWSMQWWEDQLYVGTVRGYSCWIWASLSNYLPPPPTVPEHCPAQIQDLPLQGEIWRYTPATQDWVRVYQSPASVPDPTQPGRLLAREVGFRDMTLFTEQDGTEALYVSSVFPIVLNENDPPPPRLLRSTDGETFEEVEPGTTGLGVTDRPSFSRLEVHDGRMYIIEGTIRGDGSVWESATPEAGLETFRQVTPDSLYIFEQESYNDALYLGTNTQVVTPTLTLLPRLPELLSPAEGADRVGYSVLKMDTSAAFPYPIETVVDEGAYLDFPSQGVVSMEKYGEGLYVGTDIPPEIIRINPDDSWDLIMGDPRTLPDGTLLEPLSGIGSGFGWAWNIHVWRMQAHQDALYAGTLDLSSKIFDPGSPFAPTEKFGFDLYATEDGWYFSQITINGLSYGATQGGIRTFASTPNGLYVGSLGEVEGLRIWRLPAEPQRLYLPLVVKGKGSGSAGEAVAQSSTPAALGAASQLEAEVVPAGTLLSWVPAAGAQGYHIYRTTLPDPIQSTPIEPTDGPASFERIATTSQETYLDKDAAPNGRYLYYVMAARASESAPASNVVQSPPAAAPITLDRVAERLAHWSDGSARATAAWQTPLASVESHLDRGQWGDAQIALEALRTELRQSDSLPEWRVPDVMILLNKLERRINLTQRGLLSPDELQR